MITHKSYNFKRNVQIFCLIFCKLKKWWEIQKLRFVKIHFHASKHSAPYLNKPYKKGSEFQTDIKVEVSMISPYFQNTKNTVNALNFG